MRVFAIGDMHLAGGTGKTMDRFGENWRDHDQKLFESWERISRSDDLLLIVGDTSWAMRLADATPDLDRIGRMRGRKLMLQGNHDYWWDGLAKMRRSVDPSIDFLQGSSVIIGRIGIVGTRGWTCPNDTCFEEQDLKIYQREVGRLRSGLEAVRTRAAELDHLIVALHYPPVNDRHEPSDFSNLIDEYEADICVYGHLHGEAIKSALTGVREKTQYRLVSADAAEFTPIQILETRQSLE